MKVISGLFWMAVLGLLFAAVITKTLPLRGTIPVLMYHSIGSREDAKERKNFVSRESFASQMGFLKLFGFRVIAMPEYERIFRGEQKALGREIVITFDDANETFMQEAWPILRGYQFPVTLFAVSESAKQGLNGSMTQEDFRELLQSGLVTVGSSSKTHASLPEITSGDQLVDETLGARNDLKGFLKSPIDYYAYPNGDIDPRAVEAARQSGYRLAFTTSHRKLGRLEEGPYSLTRLSITRSSDNPIIFWAKVTGIYQTHKAFWQKLKNSWQ